MNQFQKETEEGKLSGEQEVHRLREAQNLLSELKLMMQQKEEHSMDIFYGTLTSKIEALLAQIARQPKVDPETRKTIEDLTAFVTTASQMAREKGIMEKLKIISEESKKAMEAIQRAGVSPTTKEATKQSLEFVDTWRSVFQLLIRQREFRKLMVDSIKIARSVVKRYGEDVMEDVSQKVVEGEHPKVIMETAKEQIREKSETSQMTDQEWETLQEEITQVLSILAREPTYREGLNRLFNLFDLFRYSTLSSVTEATVPAAEPHAKRAQFETEELVATFTGRETMEKFKMDLRNLVSKYQDNMEVRQYLTEVREFILCSKSEEMIRSEEFKRKSKELFYRGRDLMQQFKDDPQLDNFFNTANELLENIKNDEFVKILRQQAGILTADLSYVDMDGKTHVDTDMLSKLQSVMLPVLAESLKYIPIPRIESKDKKREYWVDNIVICGYDILPENIRFHLESDSELSIRDIETKHMHTRLVIKLDKLRTELKDMNFYYKKKTFPTLEDLGRMTLRLKGDGANLQFTFNVEQDETMKKPKLTEGYVSFNIVTMDIEFDKSTIKHDLLLPMMTGLFKQQIVHEIESAVEKNLTGLVQDVAHRLTESLSEVNRPLHTGIEMARKAIKSSEIAQVHEKRKEKLE
jgi:hypothetical protein